MSKKKNRKKDQQNLLLNTTKNIDEKILATEIIEAYKKYEQEKKTEKENEENKRHAEWLKVLNQKEYPSNERWIFRISHELRNNIFLLKSLLFIKRKDVQDMHATFILMKLAVIGIFTLCKLVLCACAVFLMYGAFANEIQFVLGCMYAGLSWIFASIFRIASIEVEKIDNGNLIISIFSGVLSFVAVVIAILTIIVDKV